MPPMPKHLTKGRFLTRFDQKHSDPVQKLDVLTKLRTGVPVDQVGGIAAVDGNAGRNHLRRDWLGQGRSGPHGSTGWWNSWQGAPEPTLRCTFIRAIEISMGLTHYCPAHWTTSTPPPMAASADPGRATLRDPQLQIEYFWICGPSRFEGFVHWNSRQVTVILITPGFWASPGVPANIVEYAPDPLDQLDAWASAQETGCIYIGQDEDKIPFSPITVMKPGVITHHLDEHVRGGSGSPFSAPATGAS
jgi:hypothetical protein